MKKLFLVFSVDSALLSHRKDLAVAALKQGYEVTIVAKDTGHKSQIMQMGFKFVDLPINRVGTNIFEEFKTLYFLIRLYKKEKPDIVHHVDLKIVLWGGLAARLTKTRSVVNAVNGLGTFLLMEISIPSPNGFSCGSSNFPITGLISRQYSKIKTINPFLSTGISSEKHRPL